MTPEAEHAVLRARVEALAEHAVDWLDMLPLADHLQKSGLLSPKVQWLST